MQATMARTVKPHILMFPKLLKKLLTKGDKIYEGNVNRLRATIRKFINERRQGMTTSSESHADLISVLIESELFKNDDELIIDEIFTFFAAGMRTIQISTSNVFYFLN
jgi:cytochrome P450